MFRSDSKFNNKTSIPRRTHYSAIFTALVFTFAMLTVANVKNSHARNYRLDAHLNLGFYGTLGAGMRVDIPLLQDGLLHGKNDDISITFGADLFWIYRTYASLNVNPFGLSIPVAAQWNVPLGSKWTIAPELGLVVTPFNYNYVYAVWPHVALGFRYKFNPRNEFLIRSVLPTGLQIGLTF